MNGLIDSRIQSEYYYKFANNNTYGIKSVSELDNLEDSDVLTNNKGT